MTAPAPSPAPGTVTATVTVSPSPSPTNGGTKDGTTPVDVWTLIVAACAVLASVLSAWWSRRIGTGTVKAARDAVDESRRSAEDTARRAEADALAKRYQEAASQLGHAQAPVRLAGVYAMAKLADDWPQQRQECVDVLCSYLRMPWAHPQSGQPEDEAEQEVRRTVLELIGAHVTADPDRVSWSDLRFTFRGAALPDAEFLACRFEQQVDFTQCSFIGRLHLSGSFDRGADFSKATFHGHMEIEDIRAGGDIRFDSSRIARGGTITLYSVAPGARVSLAFARCDGLLWLRLPHGHGPEGAVSFPDLRVLSGGGFTVAQNPGVNPDGPQGHDNVEAINKASWVVAEQLDEFIKLPAMFEKTTKATEDGKVEYIYHVPGHLPDTI